MRVTTSGGCVWAYSLGGRIAAFYRYSYLLGIRNSPRVLLPLVGLSTSIDKAAYRRYYPAIVAGVNYSPKSKVDYLALMIIYTPLSRVVHLG